MVLNPRKEYPHGVRAIVKERDTSAVQVIGQLVDVRLQLCEGCGQQDMVSVAVPCVNLQGNDQGLAHESKAG